MCEGREKRWLSKDKCREQTMGGDNTCEGVVKGCLKRKDFQ